MIQNKHWLVIEDEDGPLVLARKLSAPPSEVKNFDAAMAELHLRPWRCISFDLRLPKNQHDDLLNNQFGLDLLGLSLPLTRKLVFTGFRTSDEGMDAIHQSGRDSFWVLSKGGQNKRQGKTATATPLGWTALMLHMLGRECPDAWGNLKREAEQFVEALRQASPEATQPWARSYWHQGSRHLPHPLAEAAQRYAALVKPLGSSQEVSVSREGLLALNDFREWSLWFAAAQTAVILRQQGKLKKTMPPHDDGTRQAQAWLEEQLAPLDSLPPHAPGALSWCNYLGMVQSPGPRGRLLSSTALDSLNALRLRRNEQVHGLRPQSVAESLLDELPSIMDMASFWANYPLLTEVRRASGRWRAKALAGTGLTDVDLPSNLKSPETGVDASHVYQVLWRYPALDPAEAQERLRPGAPALGTPEPVLLDWWPYLHGIPNRELGATELVLLTQPERGSTGERWLAQGLAGNLRKLRLSSNERQALLQQAPSPT